MLLLSTLSLCRVKIKLIEKAKGGEGQRMKKENDDKDETGKDEVENTCLSLETQREGRGRSGGRIVAGLGWTALEGQ